MDFRKLIQRDSTSEIRQSEPTLIEHQIKVSCLAMAEIPQNTNKNRTSPEVLS